MSESKNEVPCYKDRQDFRYRTPRPDAIIRLERAVRGLSDSIEWCTAEEVEKVENLAKSIEAVAEKGFERYSNWPMRAKEKAS